MYVFKQNRFAFIEHIFQFHIRHIGSAILFLDKTNVKFEFSDIENTIVVKFLKNKSCFRLFATFLALGTTVRRCIYPIL